MSINNDSSNNVCINLERNIDLFIKANQYVCNIEKKAWPKKVSIVIMYYVCQRMYHNNEEAIK